MLQLTEYDPEQTETGCFYLVTSNGEHGPYGSYGDAVNAAEDPRAPLHGLDPRRGYCVVDRREQEDA